MKNLVPINVILFLVLRVLFPGSHFSLNAQNVKAPKASIIFSNNKSYKPRLEIAKKNRFIAYRPEGDSLLHGSKITAISGDTIFIDDTCYRVPDLASINFDVYLWQTFPSTNNILIEDSLVHKDSGTCPSGWTAYYPPADISSDHFAFSYYLRELKHEIAREKREKTNPLICSNFLKLNVAKLFHLEFAIAYEIKIDSAVSWETEIGYQVGIETADAYYTFPYPIYNYEGVTLTTYPKFYCAGPNFYISPVLLYKFLYFNGVRTNYPIEGSDGGYLQDQKRNDLGLSLRIGTMKRYGRFIVDFYFGLGYKWSWIDQSIYGSYLYHDSGTFRWNNPDHSPDRQTTNVSAPIVNLGIKVGVGF